MSWTPSVNPVFLFLVYVQELNQRICLAVWLTVPLCQRFKENWFRYYRKDTGEFIIVYKKDFFFFSKEIVFNKLNTIRFNKSSLIPEGKIWAAANTDLSNLHVEVRLRQFKTILVILQLQKVNGETPKIHCVFELFSVFFYRINELASTLDCEFVFHQPFELLTIICVRWKMTPYSKIILCNYIIYTTVQKFVVSKIFWNKLIIFFRKDTLKGDMTL